MIRNTSFAAAILMQFTLFSQENIPVQQLDTVVIKSARIDLPFKENSRTIHIISSSAIKNGAATNVVELLQQVAGVDIRRRGTAGSQADLYIRGGGFDQTLLLIDGIKMDDSQTGHHTLNAAVPLEVIERIEIIKGPAARVFGQNAFTGAINIVTKNRLNKTAFANLEAGSFGQLNGSVTVGKEFENASFMAHVGALTSDGYRTNSDYNNYNYFLKGVLNTQKQSIEVLATFFDKKFGAENFYTTNPAFHEYEETQSSLIGVSTTFRSEKFKITPRVYWKRGQDMFLLKRDDPSFYRNLHITNKVGAEVNASYISSLGVTGFGVDVASVSISSNNLGKRDRIMASLFVEHRLNLLNEKLDITPGVALTYFSDFKFHAFPGLDLGYAISDKIKAYGNIGYTYRIPTFTDLFYKDPVTVGNENLKPEESFAQEIGLKFNQSNFFGAIAFFNRDAKNLIDYVRPNTNQSVFTATNIAEVNTKGFELDASYLFKINEYQQTFKFGYSYLDDTILNQNKDLSRYSLNTLKHQFTARFSTKFFKNVRQNIIYKHAQRTIGTAYNVWDASVLVDFRGFNFTLTANNIFNALYIESGFIPMPPSSIVFGMRYGF